jgi:hypothetical protein
MNKFLRKVFGVGALVLTLVLGQATVVQAKNLAGSSVTAHSVTPSFGIIGPYGSYQAAYAAALNLAAQGYSTQVYQAVDGYWYINAN